MRSFVKLALGFVFDHPEQLRSSDFFKKFHPEIFAVLQDVAIYRFLIFVGVSASHGSGPAFIVEIKAIHSNSQAFDFDSAITLLLLRDVASDTGRKLPMATIASARPSSFGLRCVHCDNELIAPEWTEHSSERHIRHLWHCRKCDCRFETVIDTNKMTTDEILRLVA
jgi:hypothetical protein